MVIEGLRAMRPDDSTGIIALVGAAYDEYAGCVLDLPGVDADLPELADRLVRLGGQGWVVEHTGLGGILACVGWAPTGAETAELKRLYVTPAARGRGLATSLVELVTATAREHGARWLELWSDTRFLDAHRLYERCGFTRLPATRHLDDPSDTTEYHFVRTI